MSNEVAKRPAGAVPAYLQSDDLGVDTIGQKDIIIPRLKIIQPTTKDKDEGWKDGYLYNSMTRESSKSIEMFILMYWPSTIWFSEDFKMLGQTYIDASTKHEVIVGQPGDPDKGKSCYNYMVLTDIEKALETKEIPIPSIFSCMSAAQKTARQLNSKLMLNAQSKKIPIWAQLVEVKTVLQKFDKGQAYMPVFAFPRLANKEEADLLKQAFMAARNMQHRASKVGDDEFVEKTPF